MKNPKEPADAKAARLRERRLAELDRNSATQQLATGLTSDIRGTYGNRVSMFGLAPSVARMPSVTPGSLFGFKPVAGLSRANRSAK